MQFPKLLTVAAGLLVGGVAFATLNPFLQEAPVATDQHKQIQKGVGNWAGTMDMHMPGMPAMTVPCSESVTTVGDFWTTSNFETNFMGVDFKGASTLGFDTTTNQFVGTWIDSQNTSMTTMSGQFDEAKQAIVMLFKGKSMMGGLVDMRMETSTTGDTMTSSHFELVDGKETLTMSINMKRVAAESAPVNAGGKVKSGKVIKKARKAGKAGKVKIGGKTDQ